MLETNMPAKVEFESLAVTRKRKIVWRPFRKVRGGLFLEKASVEDFSCLPANTKTKYPRFGIILIKSQNGVGAETPPRQFITVLRIRGLRGTWIVLLFNMFTETFFPLKRENMHRLFSQVRRVDTSSSLHPCPLSGDNRLTSLLECLGDVRRSPLRGR